MVIKYFSDDGVEFTNKWDCITYEETLKNKAVLNVDFFTKDGDLYHVDSNKMYDDYVYCNAEVIVVHDDDELTSLRWLTEYCGWMEFDDIKEVGTWVRREKESECYVKDYEWVRI